MNNLLNIKLRFEHESKNGSRGSRNLTKTRSTKSSLLERLIVDLQRIKSFYNKRDIYVDNILIDAYYNDIIAKSGRIQELFKDNNDCNDKIVGARFSESSPNENHIITYYISRDNIDSAIKKLKESEKLIDEQLNGVATSANFDALDTSIDYSRYSIAKSKLRNAIIDCSVLEKFDIPAAASEIDKDQVIVTFFQTENSIDDLLYKLGIEQNNYNYYYYYAGKNTISVNKDLYRLLLEKVPYMISMATSDISQLQPIADEVKIDATIQQITTPTKEPIIGVIDTMFDKKVYFGEWVDYREYLDEHERTSVRKEDYNHGTAVSSIIVDGPALNPNLEDNCGRFRVRHFGVCPGKISPSLLVKKVIKIVNENTDIHVWNLSLGTDDEVSRNFISFDAAALDEIQQKKNVIFVVSGTNDNERRRVSAPYKRVGSPADSLNSLVVNSVRFNGEPASYTRNGKVLSFFNKPDVSYYGGDYDERITVYSNNGLEQQYGTSFAAPWVSRKLCYLIEIMGLSREVAKALIIDSAAGWEYKQKNYKYQNLIGYGIVPKSISSVINSDNSEIKFVVQGIANTYYTSNYGIPIPKEDGNKTNYIARATVCYFPKCNRLQGVDYTQRELSIKFGRILKNGIKDINKNTQDEDDAYNFERTARRDFRKWENTKLISNLFNPRRINRLDLYGDGMWGISLASKERSTRAEMADLPFGIVITLKHTGGLNRINDFKHACLLRGYIVNEVRIDNQVELYDKAQETIKFD